MSRTTALAILVAFTAGCAAPAPAPGSLDPVTTPPASPMTSDPCHVGELVYCAVNLAVNDANVQQTICNPAWTALLRPPTYKTNTWKREILAAYHLPGKISDYEGDHRAPEAALGGDPGAYYSGYGSRFDADNWILTDQAIALPNGVLVPANFALESPPSPNDKDIDEKRLGDQVCHRHRPFLTLTEARVLLRDKWLAPYPAYKVPA